MNGLLSLFESALASAADSALSNPTGGFLTYLQKNPPVAVLYSVAVTTAHSYLAALEAKLAPTAAPVSPLASSPAA